MKKYTQQYGLFLLLFVAAISLNFKNVNLLNNFSEVELSLTIPSTNMAEVSKNTEVETIDIPNTFSPNGDGRNDLFLKGYSLKVFNSIGILLYNGVEGWDGNYKGRPVAVDTYFYTVTIEGVNGQLNKTGFITLVR